MGFLNWLLGGQQSRLEATHESRIDDDVMRFIQDILDADGGAVSREVTYLGVDYTLRAEDIPETRASGFLSFPSYTLRVEPSEPAGANALATEELVIPDQQAEMMQHHGSIVVSIGDAHAEWALTDYGRERLR